MSLGNHSFQQPDQEAQINIVPLVDVALVLLIIFMLTATFSKSTALRVRLPESSTAQISAFASRNAPIFIQMDSRGNLFLSGRRISEDELKAALFRLSATEKSREEIVLQGDRNASYGEVAHILDSAKNAGISNITLEMRYSGNTRQIRTP